ncbi:MAG: hypothetical protein LH473_12370 [Chitinophagales bacterium]|nr:hypothetical protein [Chitinophagales bacterium]
MKKIIFIFIISLFISPINIFAQDKPEESSGSPDNSSASPDSKSYIPFKDRIFVGGSFALSFGNVTYIGVSPIVGYHFTPKLSGGVGISYYYWKDNIYHYENSIYGGLLFSRYIVYKGLFLEADFEANNNYAYFNDADN